MKQFLPLIIFKFFNSSISKNFESLMLLVFNALKTASQITDVLLTKAT